MGRIKSKNTILLITGALFIMLLLISMLMPTSYGASVGDTEQFYRKQSWSSTPYTLFYYSKNGSSIAYCLESGVAAPQTSSGISFKNSNSMFAYYLKNSLKSKYEEMIEVVNDISEEVESLNKKADKTISGSSNDVEKTVKKTVLSKIYYLSKSGEKGKEVSVYRYNIISEPVKPSGMPSSNWETYLANLKTTIAKWNSQSDTLLKNYKYSYDKYQEYITKYNKYKDYDTTNSKATTYKYVTVNNINANGKSTLKNKVVSQDSNIRLVLSRAYPIVSLSDFKATTGYSNLTTTEFKLAVQQAVYTLTNGKRFSDYETANTSEFNKTSVKEVTAILLSGLTSYTGYENDVKIRENLNIDYSKIDNNVIAPSVTIEDKNDKIIRNDDGSLEKNYSITYYGKVNTNISIKINNKQNSYLENKAEDVYIICDDISSTSELTIAIKPGETKTFTVKVKNASDFGKIDNIVTAQLSYKKLNDVIYIAAQNGYGYYKAASLTEIPSKTVTYTKTIPKLMDSSEVTYTSYPGAGGSSWVSAVYIQDLVVPSYEEVPVIKTIGFEWMAENGSISFKKVDQDGNLVNGAIFQLKAIDTASKDLSNADFSLVNLVDEGTDKEKGVVRFTNIEGQEFKINKLPLGTYSVTEVVAPVGYIKNTKVYSVTLAERSNIVDLTAVQEDLVKNGGIVNTKIVMDLALEKWVDNVQEEEGNKTYEARNTYDSDVENRAGNIYVKEGDIVTYNLRIFNHGNVSATAEEITDTIANGLEFIEDNEINKKYGWYVGKDGKVHTEILKNEWIPSHVTEGTAHNGLNYHSTDAAKEAISCDTCNYLDVKISFKVKNLDAIDKIINVAEITKYKSSYDGFDAWTTEVKNEETGEIEKQEYKAEDIDSSEKNHPDNHDFESKTNSGENGRNEGDYYREDDEDIAVIIPQRFDLSLEKWVSQVIRKDEEGTEKNIYTNGKNTDDNNVESRPGDISVRAGDTVIYTIRVYNQGNIDGYAQEIMDSSPEGLEFINPENSDKIEDSEIGYNTNKLYLWQVSDGLLKTNFLSKENEKGIKTSETVTSGESDVEIDLNSEEQETPTFIELMQTEGLVEALKQSEDAIKPENEQSSFYKMYKDGTKLEAHENGTSHVGYNYNKGENEATPCEKCAYKDIQIAFRVADDASSKTDENGRIINLAQINKALSEATEKTGEIEIKYEELKDIDSIPGNHGEFVEGETREDDEDIAVIVPEIFDLALRKWITSYIKTVDGVSETVTTTQDHTSTLDEKSSSKLVKIDLDYKKLSTTQIKINYAIRVENQGTIPGYVKELTDYLPYGTEFYVEDNLDEKGNPYWVLDGDVLKTSEGYEDEMNTLMNPGDTQMFYLTLRWVNSEENMGLKTNTVEISKDHNEWNTPDIDSTPGNILERFYEPEKWEDEEDAVPFLLTVRTGEWMIQIGIIVGALAVVLAGLIILRKRLANRI